MRVFLRRPVFSTIISASLLASCSSVGPARLVPTHEGYNDAVQLTMTRELLKNIVRDRYLDPVQFITVGSINATFSVGAGTQAGVGGIGTALASGTAGANISFSDTPTITFLPVSASSVFRALAAPIDLPEALGYAFNWGRLRPHEVGFVIGAINDAPDRVGPEGEGYRARLAALIRLFDRGATLRYRREFTGGHHTSIPKESIDGQAFSDAAEWGAAFWDAGDGNVNLNIRVLRIHLAVPLPHESETADDLRLLGLTPGKESYAMLHPGLARPAPLGLQEDTIWLVPRSPARMFELLTLTVEVPNEHIDQGIAPPPEGLLNSSVELPVRIRHSATAPSASYRVQHRGYWFYIDDTDMPSKHVFLSLLGFYMERLGSEAPRTGIPPLVLPIGR